MSKRDIHPVVSGAGWIGSFAGALVSELESVGVSYEDIHKLGGDTKLGRQLVHVCAEAIARFVRGVEGEFLKLIPGAQPVVIEAVSGTEVLADATDTFAYIDSDFKGYGADAPGPATKDTPVFVYELTEDATFAQMFASLGTDLNKACLTQAQIKCFVRKHRNWLRTDGYGTFFLFKSKDQFFVADVDVHSDGTLGVGVYRLEYDYVWHAGLRHRVVALQLAV